MVTKYYTLIGVNRQLDRAEIIFGSHLRSEVKFEMDEYKYTKKIMGRDSEYTEFAIIQTETYMNDDVNAAIAEWERKRRNAKLEESTK